MSHRDTRKCLILSQTAAGKGECLLGGVKHSPSCMFGCKLNVLWLFTKWSSSLQIVGSMCSQYVYLNIHIHTYTYTYIYIFIYIYIYKYDTYSYMFLCMFCESHAKNVTCHPPRVAGGYRCSDLHHSGASEGGGWVTQG